MIPQLLQTDESSTDSALCEMLQVARTTITTQPPQTQDNTTHSISGAVNVSLPGKVYKNSEHIKHYTCR